MNKTLKPLAAAAALGAAVWVGAAPAGNAAPAKGAAPVNCGTTAYTGPNGTWAGGSGSAYCTLTAKVSRYQVAVVCTPWIAGNGPRTIWGPVVWREQASRATCNWNEQPTAVHFFVR